MNIKFSKLFIIKKNYNSKKSNIIELNLKFMLFLQKKDNYIYNFKFDRDDYIMRMKNQKDKYEQELNSLKNNKINSFVNLDKNNKNLQILLENNLLDKSIEIQQIMEDSVNALMNKQLPVQKETDQYNITSCDQNNDVIKKFQENFLDTPKDQQMKMLENLKLSKNIRNYEDMIFDHYRNNDLTLRKKGKIKFNDLTVKEQFNYLKHNVDNVQDLFQMFDNTEICPQINSAMVQKLATIRLRSDESILFMISDNRYRSMMRNTTQNVQYMSNQDFCNVLFALGKIHQYEQGIIYPKLWNVLKNKIHTEIEKRIGDLDFLQISLVSDAYLKIKMDKQISQIILKKIQMIDLYSFNSKLIALSQTNIEEENVSINMLTKIMLFLSEIEQSEIVLQYLKYIQQNKIQELEKMDLINIIYSISGCTQKEIYIESIKEFLSHSKIVSCVQEMTIDDMSLLSVLMVKISYKNSEIIKEMKKKFVRSIKLIEQCDQQKLCMTINSFVHFDIIKQNPEFVTSKPVDIQNLMLIFPQFVFNQKSPNFIPYSKASQQISMELANFSSKWMVSTICSLSTLGYSNMQFYSQVFEFLLQKGDMSQFQLVQLMACSYNLLDCEEYFNQFQQIFIENCLTSKNQSQETVIQYLLLCTNLIENDLQLIQKLIQLINLEVLNNNQKIMLLWSSLSIFKEKQNLINKFINDIRQNSLEIQQINLQFLLNQSISLLNDDIQKEDIVFQESCHQRLKQFFNTIRNRINQKHQLERQTLFQFEQKISEILQDAGFLITRDHTTDDSIFIPILINQQNIAVFPLIDDFYKHQQVLAIIQNQFFILKNKYNMKVMVISSKECQEIQGDNQNIQLQLHLLQKIKEIL